MARFVQTAFGLCGFVLLVSNLHLTSARQCPDCDAQYWTCSWDCYEEYGSAPICASLISYKTGSATEVTVFNNECEAGCYVKAYNEFYAVQGYEPKSEQQPDARCDAAWKRNQALDYQFFSSPDAFKYNNLLAKEEDLPRWMQDELAAVKADPSLVNDPQLALTLEECSVCKPGADISGRAVLLTADGSLAPEGNGGELPAASPATETPIPIPDVPVMPSPALAPILAPTLAPIPAPTTGSGGPISSPAEIVIPGSSAHTALSTLFALVGGVLAFLT